MRIPHRLAVAFVVLVGAGLGLACGNPDECSRGASCRATPTSTADASRAIVVATKPGASPIASPSDAIASPSAIYATVPPVPVVTASATAIPPTPAEPTIPPLATATLMPPPPDQITPRPTDRPFTPDPRPDTPVAGDIKLGSDGKYYADVDGCHWSEYGRFPSLTSGNIEIGLQTPCLPYEGLLYDPKTGNIDHIIS